jgi:hypothetical protein
MSGAAIAAEVAAALAEAGAAVGDGALGAVIKRQGDWSGPDWDRVPGEIVEYPVTVLDFNINVKDAAGTLTGEIRRRLLVEAAGVVPEKGDIITLRGVDHTVDTVETLAPGGVDLLYKVMLER